VFNIKFFNPFRFIFFGKIGCLSLTRQRIKQLISFGRQFTIVDSPQLDTLHKFISVKPSLIIENNISIFFRRKKTVSIKSSHTIMDPDLKSKTKSQTEPYSVNINGIEKSSIEIDVSDVKSLFYVKDGLETEVENFNERKKFKIKIFLALASISESFNFKEQDGKVQVQINENFKWDEHNGKMLISDKIFSLADKNTSKCRKYVRFENSSNYPFRAVSQSYVDPRNQKKIEQNRMIIDSFGKMAIRQFLKDYQYTEKEISDFENNASSLDLTDELPKIFKIWNESFHSSEYYKDNLKNLNKFFEDKKFEPWETMEFLHAPTRMLLEQLAYNPEKFKKNEFPSSAVHLCINALLYGLSLSKASGFLTKLFDHEDGTKTPLKEKMIVQVIKLLLEWDRMEELTLEEILSRLNVPQKQSYKFEGKTAFDEKHKVRAINSDYLLHVIIQYMFFHPFKKFAQHNIPFYWGFDKLGGGVNEIVRAIFLRYSEMLKKHGICDKMFFFSIDIARQDYSQSVGLMKHAMWLCISMFYDLDEVVSPIHDDDDYVVKQKKKIFSILRVSLNCNASPIISNTEKPDLFITVSRYMPSGCLTTSINNSIASALIDNRALIRMVRRMNQCFKKSNGEVVHDCSLGDFMIWEQLKRRYKNWDDMFLVYKNLIMKYAPFIVMGDNNLLSIPLVYLPFFLNEGQIKATTTPITVNIERYAEQTEHIAFKSFLADSCNTFGMEVKKEESCAGIFNPPFRNGSVKVDYTTGRANTAVFCSWAVVKATFNGILTYLPYRSFSTMISKLAPRNQFDSMIIYLIKLVSIYRDNCHANPQVEHFITILYAIIVKSLHKTDFARLEALEEVRKRNYEEFMDKYRFLFDKSTTDTKQYYKNVDSVHALPSRNETFKKLVQVSDKYIEINEKRRPKYEQPIPFLSSDRIRNLISIKKFKNTNSPLLYLLQEYAGGSQYMAKDFKD